jgi:hypothetical protein
MLTQGVPLKVVQETLGHSSITVTADIYAHVAPELQRQAADAMQAALTAKLTATPANPGDYWRFVTIRGYLESLASETVRGTRSDYLHAALNARKTSSLNWPKRPSRPYSRGMPPGYAPRRPRAGARSLRVV